jgi:DNA-binding GntR family transcriptional regulator
MEYLSKSDIVTAELRQLIRDGEMPPGTVLRQRDIAQRFGISPTPVREALRRLEAEGYVNTQTHREATVVSVDPVRVQEDYLIMANLESLAAGLAAEKATPADIAEIAALDTALGDANLSADEVNELNRRFHFRIYECARSPILLSLLNLLWRSATARLPAAIRHDQMVQDHAEIIAAIREGSAKDAAACTRRHIMATNTPA